MADNLDPTGQLNDLINGLSLDAQSVDPPRGSEIPHEDLSPRVRTKAQQQDDQDASSALDEILAVNPNVDVKKSIPGADPAAEQTIDGLLNSDTNVASEPQLSFTKQVARGAGATVNTMSDMATSAVIYGPMKAANAVAELPADLGISSFMESIVPLGGFQVFDKDWNFAPRYVPHDEMYQLMQTGQDLKGIPDGITDAFRPRTLGGGLAGGISQFVTSLYFGGKVVPKAAPDGSTLVKTLTKVAQSGTGTFMGFSAHEDRLSNLIQQFPSLQNPVTEFLASDKETPEVLDRLKGALEGEIAAPILDKTFKAFIGGLRTVKRLRAGNTAGGSGASAGAATAAIDHKPVMEEATKLLSEGSDLVNATPEVKFVLESMPHDLKDAITKQAEWKQTVEQTKKAMTPEEFKTWQETNKSPVPGDVLLRANSYLARESKRVAANPNLAKPKIVPEDPDAILGDPNAPLISDQPSGLVGEMEKGKAASTDPATAGNNPAAPYPPGQSAEAGDLPPVGTAAKIDPKIADVYKRLQNGEVTAEDLKTIAAGAEPVQTGKGTVYINFAHINTPDDLKNVIQSLTDKNKGVVDAARRGEVSWDKTADRAMAEDGWQTILDRRRGGALNAEQLLATKELWITMADKTFRLAKLATANPSDANVYAARRMVNLFQMVNAEVLGGQAEAGRALNILKKPVGVKGESMPKYLVQAIEMNGGREKNIEFFSKLAQMADDPDAFARLAEKVEPSTMERILGGVQDFWIGGALLTGPKTHMRNMISNTATMFNEALERGIAGKVGEVMGEPGASADEGVAYLTGAVSSMKQALSAAWMAAKRNESAFGSSQFDAGPTRLNSKGTLVEGTPLGWGIDALGAYSSLSSRALVSQDEFFKGMNYSGSIASQAYREAARDVATGLISKDQLQDRIAELISNPTEAMKAKAFDQAHYATFTSPPGAISKAILSVSQEHPSLKFIVPFVKTPANLFKYAFERSPLGFTSQRYKAAMEAGGHEATMARTRIGMGTVVTLMALDMALEGKIIGDPAQYVQDPAQKEWINRNSMQYSIAVPNGDGSTRHFSYQGIDPLGLTLGMAANIASAVKASQDGELTDEEEEQLSKSITSMMFYASDYALSRSYMQGFSDFFAAATDPNMNAERWQNKFVSGFIPNWSAEANRVMDPLVRDGSTMTNAIMRKTLTMSEGVPAIRDRFGRTSTYESGLGKAYDAISPFYSKKTNPTPWENEEQRQGFYVSAPAPYMTVDKVRVNIKNPEIYLELKRIRGQMKPSEMGDYPEAKKLIDKYGDVNLLDLLNDIATGNHPLYVPYSQRSDGKGNEKDAFIDKIVRDYSKAAKTKMFHENVQLQMMYERAAKRKINRDERID